MEQMEEYDIQFMIKVQDHQSFLILSLSTFLNIKDPPFFTDVTGEKLVPIAPVTRNWYDFEDHESPYPFLCYYNS